MTQWTDRTAGINVGDKICYKASFLRSTGRSTGDTPHLRGVVTEIKRFGGSIDVATVEWKGEEEPQRVAIKNLSRVTERGIADD